MPALPVLDSQNLARGLANVSNVIVRRGVDHRVLETIAVGTLPQSLSVVRIPSFTNEPVATIVIGMGGLLYWGIVRKGSCSWRKK